MATQIPEDTRQALHLERVEGSTAWLGDDDTDGEDEYHSDPQSLLERREQERGVNAFGQPIN
jgi:hypothetical protein